MDNKQKGEMLDLLREHFDIVFNEAEEDELA